MYPSRAVWNPPHHPPTPYTSIALHSCGTLLSLPCPDGSFCSTALGQCAGGLGGLGTSAKGGVCEVKPDMCGTSSGSCVRQRPSCSSIPPYTCLFCTCNVALCEPLSYPERTIRPSPFIFLNAPCLFHPPPFLFPLLSPTQRNLSTPFAAATA